MSYASFIQEAAKNRGGNYSRRDMVDLAVAMFNDSDNEMKVYTKKGETYEAKSINPGANLKNGLIAPILKSMGVDKAEIAKLATVETSKAGGEALVDFATLMIKSYVGQNGMGRKLTLPMTSPNETIQSISTVAAEQETRETTMIVKGDDGNYTTTPTGKAVTTAAHEKLVGKNRVPVWLKTTSDVKK